MRERLIVLRERRAQLVERAAGERARLGALVERTDVASRWLAAGGRLAAEAKQHPLWLLAGVALLTALRPRRMIGWMLRGWTLYQMYSRGRAVLERFAPALAGAGRAN